MEQKAVSCDIAGKNLTLSTGLFKTQAGGTITVTFGDTVILCVASISDDPKEGADFFPMVVDYEERYYAAGKIKGSRFIKREGRPSENAILRSRMIDRPIRPLFPKGLTHDVQLVAVVLSTDQETDPGAVAMTGASMALLAAGGPFQGPVAAVRIGLVNGKLIVNPTYKECEEGNLDLVVAGTKEAITMVEAGAKEVDEERMLKALEMAHEEIKKLCDLQLKFLKDLNITPKQITLIESNAAAVEAVEKTVTKEMLDNVKGKTKKEFKENFKKLVHGVLEKYAKDIEEEKMKKSEIEELVNDKVEKNMRENVLEKGIRVDGRKTDEIRPLSCKVGILPRTHGTGLFQRGETQVLSVATLGAPGDAQIIDTMDTDETKRYIHHYNFPPYAVGEIKPFRGPSRREIGHGDLAERALMAVLPSKEECPYTIWVVSETLSCNGSSSMASVCGSTLALMDAGIKIRKPVAGIAMGLISRDGDVTKGYKILTDIQGIEDFSGDMDFKVTGTDSGITALQMDIKVKGLSIQVLREALEQAKKARLQILDEIIKTIAAPRVEMSQYAPLITTLRINPDNIRDVIGKGGETIQKITAECEVEIDIEQDGLIFITAPNQENGKKAIDWINRITYVPKPGEIFEGKVTRIIDFGAFVEILPGKEGLVHISQLAKERINKVEDVVKLGDQLKVKLMEIDDQGRLNLSHKATFPGAENEPYSGGGRPSRPSRPFGQSGGRPPRR